MIRVLVVDDSPIMVRMLSELINTAPKCCVVGTASHGYEALRKAKDLRPDVITMDVNMPRMDGLSAVEHIMSTVPTPIVMISSLTIEGAEATLKALELGAIDFISKPSGYVSLDIGELEDEIISKITLAAKIRVVRTVKRTRMPAEPAASSERQRQSQSNEPDIEDAIFRYVLSGHTGNAYDYNRLVVIGCSTGGPQALNDIVRRFPANFPAPILVVQHMPEKFTGKLAELLNKRVELTVVEAKNAMKIQKGVVYIAPGAYHMKVNPDRTLVLFEGTHNASEPCPSVDMLMQSAANIFGEQVVGVILTGMGNDGTIGMNAIKDAHGATIAQDEDTSLVFGMPKEAIQSGCVDAIVPLNQVADEIMTLVRKT